LASLKNEDEVHVYKNNISQASDNQLQT